MCSSRNDDVSIGIILKVNFLNSNYDHLAPDGTEIRLLTQCHAAGICHCTLAAGGISKAVKHKTVTELWYVLEGIGQIWLSRGKEENVSEISQGASFSIEPGDSFQLFNNSKTPLKILITTIPAWPGSHEAELVVGKW